MDSARVSAEIHIVTYDDGNWWVYSKQKQCWLNASVLSFDRVANELYIKAYEQIANKTIFTKLNFNSIKWTCWTFFRHNATVFDSTYYFTRIETL